MIVTNYTHKTDHRNQSHQKSQWTISRNDELNCFHLMCENNWYKINCGWGMHLVRDLPTYLGVGVKRERQLFIAKFVDGNINGNWHGYPADYEENSQDIPPEDILISWYSAGYIKFAKVRKIIKQQPCRI